jgi:hypothetical protein
MAVLRHGSLGLPGVTRCDHLIRFEDFARAVADFERCLKPGGLLIIRHSNFRLCDAPVACAFETILQLPADAGTPLFGSDNRLLPIADIRIPFSARSAPPEKLALCTTPPCPGAFLCIVTPAPGPLPAPKTLRLERTSGSRH